MLAGSGLDRGALLEDLIDAAYVQAMDLHGELPYTEQEFVSVERQGRGEVIGRAVDIEKILLESLRLLAELRQGLNRLEAGKWLDTRGDIAGQLSFLLRRSFLRDTPAEWLAQYPRYLKALRHRLERLSGQYQKDSQHVQMLAALTEPLAAMLDERPDMLLLSGEASDYRWMLEEFRVSLFAQSLGTRRPVSQKRLAQQWQMIVKWRANNPH